jgi:cbb3-type cytochrome oxidase subunit 3
MEIKEALNIIGLIWLTVSVIAGIYWIFYKIGEYRKKVHYHETSIFFLRKENNEMRRIQDSIIKQIEKITKNKEEETNE